MPNDSPWKRSRWFADWIVRVTISVGVISEEFTEYTTRMFKEADQMFRTPGGGGSPQVKLDPRDRKREATYNLKLRVLLLNAVPERVRTTSLRNNDQVTVSADPIVDALCLHVNPGGEVAAYSLLKVTKTSGGRYRDGGERCSVRMADCKKKVANFGIE